MGSSVQSGRNAVSYTHLKTWEVHEQVLQNLGLDYTYEQLEGMLTISNPSDTRMLYITVSSADPVEATNIANEYANVARDYIYRMMAVSYTHLLLSRQARSGGGRR